MDKFEFYPDRKRLAAGAALGLILAGIGLKLTSIMGDATAAPMVLALAFCGIGALLLLKTLTALIRPRPCFVGDETGFSVMGKPRRGWDELRGVQIRSLTLFMIPANRWVSVEVAKSPRGVSRRLEIPWTHLPGPARDTVDAIHQLAGMRRKRAGRPDPALAYDPYDPAALERARARTL